MQEISRFAAPIVILGDSHAIPLGFSDEKILNLSRGGDSFAEMRAKLDYLLKHGRKPDKVVLSLSWHSFSRGRAVRNNRQQGDLFCDRSSHREIYGEKSWEFFFRRSLLERYPLLNPVNARLSRRYLIHRLFPEERRADSWRTATPAEKEQMMLDRLRVHYSQPFDSDQVVQLKGLLQLCKSHGLAIVAIRMPVTPDYNELIQTTDEYREGRILLKALGIEVKDWNEEDTGPNDFENQDHLVRYSPTARKIRQWLIQESL